MNIRQKRAEETKQKIYNTAMELFLSKGFNQVTVNEIIKKTNTSKGAFYTHFESKHHIFLEKFKEIDKYYVDELIDRLIDKKSYREKLLYFSDLQMQYIQDCLGLDVVRTIYEHELNPSTTSFFLIPDRPLYIILSDLFCKGKEAGEFRKDLTTEQMVRIWSKIMRGLLYDWSISNGSYSLVNEQKLLFSTCLDGFMKNEENG